MINWRNLSSFPCNEWPNSVPIYPVWWVFVVGIAGLLVACIYALRQPDMFESDSVLMIAQNMKGAAGQDGNLTQFSDTQIQLMQSMFFARQGDS